MTVINSSQDQASNHNNDHEKKAKILLFDFCNFQDYPIGGYLTFARNLMLSFSNELALVGITTEKDDPILKWFKKKVNGFEFDFFALARYDKSKSKHIIPDRLICFILLKLYKKRILQIGVQNAFIQRPEILIAVRNFAIQNICYQFAGLENPLRISKYWYSRYFATYFDKIFFDNFRNVKVILAAGNEDEINRMQIRSNGAINNDAVLQFPTRINTKIFKKLNKIDIRRNLGIPESYNVISTTGRLSWLKGWKFMIDCFVQFLQFHPDSLLYFIGEGEDYNKIEVCISSLGLQKKIVLAGTKSQNEIAQYLNASDLFIMGSYKEGWSTTLIEAIACGVPVCTTNFSSAKEIITEGVTGYVEEHDITSFTNKMNKCLSIDATNLPLPSDVNKYEVSELKNSILKHWTLI